MKFAACVMAILQFLSLARAAAPELVNGIAVIVGDAVITYKDLQRAMEDDVEFLARRFSNQPQILDQKLRELEKEKLDLLIENQLVLQEFKRAGYVIPESYIQNRINEDIKKYGDRLTLTKTLQAQGLTYESYRTRVRERIIMDLMWRQRVPVDPIVSPKKIEDYYAENKEKFRLEDQVKLRMIVLTNSSGTVSVSASRLADEIIAKLKEGVDFAELAKVYSHGSKAAEGGDWGWVEKKVLREDLRDSAFSLKPGQFSQPIETSSGIFIMLVEDTKLAHIRALPEVKDEIEQTLKAEEMKRLRTQWIDQLKSKAFIRSFAL